MVAASHSEDISQAIKSPRANRGEQGAPALLGPVSLLMIALLAMALQFCYDGARWGNAGYFDAEHRYLPAARELLNQGVSYLSTPQSVENAPMSYLWPALFGANVGAMQVGNLLLLAVGAVLIADAAARLYGRGAGWIGGILYATGYQLIHYSSTALSEPINTFFITLAFWFWIYREGKSIRFGAAAGLSLGFAALSRPVFSLVLPFLFLAAIIEVFRQRDPRALLAAVFTMGIVIGGVMVKNFVCCREFRIANGGGAVLYMGADLRWYGDQPVTWGAEYDTDAVTGGLPHVTLKGDEILTRRGEQMLLAHPWRELGLIPLKFYRFIVGQPDELFFRQNDLMDEARQAGDKSALELLLWFAIPLIAIHLFGLGGLVDGVVVNPTLWLLPGAVVVAPLLAHSILFSLPRFSAPLWGIFVVAGIALFRVKLPLRRTMISVICVLISLVLLGACFYYSVFPRLMVSRGQLENFRTMWIGDGKWEKTHDVQAIAGGKGREWKSVGIDPFLIMQVTPAAPFGGNTVVFVELSLTRAAHRPRIQSCQLFYATVAGAFTENHSVHFEVLADGKPHLYQICTASSGELEGRLAYLRLDMPDDTPGETATVKQIIIAK